MDYMHNAKQNNAHDDALYAALFIILNKTLW